MDIAQLTLLVAVILLLLANVSLIVWLPAYIGRKLQQRELTTSKTYDVHVEGVRVINEMDLHEVEQRTREQLMKAAGSAAKRLQESLDNTVDQIASNINDMTSTQLAQEFEKYQVSLQALRDQSIAEFDKIQHELDLRKDELLDHLEREIAKEKERRIDTLTTRINDVVASYLTETLGNQVDLGAQTTYIFAALEQHKADIKRDILS